MEGRRETRSIHQNWNITSCSSCDTHLGSSPGWGKIPIPRGVMINNAFVWRCERRYSKAFAYLTCQLLLSSRGHAMLLWRVCVCVVGWVQYLHTYHHVLFISHLDVSIYPVPQRKSTLIKQESTQDHTTSVQLCLHPVRAWLHFEYNEHSANYDSIVLIQWKH